MIPLARLILVGLVLLWAGPVSAQIAPRVSALVNDATGVTFTMTWVGGGIGGLAEWRAGYGDGSVTLSGTNTPPLAVALPYHASGASSAIGYFCVGLVATQQCIALNVQTVPPLTTTHTLGYTEPTENNCTGDPTCTVPLTDLAEIRAYYRIDGGPERIAAYPATSPTGGLVVLQPLTVPATSGTLTVSLTAVDTSGNESLRSETVSKIIDAQVPGPSSVKPGVTIRYQ